jgi:hypothetical protein
MGSPSKALNSSDSDNAHPQNCAGQKSDRTLQSRETPVTSDATREASRSDVALKPTSRAVVIGISVVAL